MSESNPFESAPVIHAYTRAQAIDDGVLVDVSAAAREVGFRIPVALTRAVWEDCVAWNNEREKVYQDESGRLHDVLWMAMIAARRASDQSEILFSVLRVKRGTKTARHVRLKLHIGAGDNGEPVFTIMQPDED